MRIKKVMKKRPANDWDLSNYDLSEYSSEDIEAIIWHVRRFGVVPGYIRHKFKNQEENHAKSKTSENQKNS